MHAREIIRLLGGATFLAGITEYPRSRIANWPMLGIPARYWGPLRRLAGELNVPAITEEVLETHTFGPAEPAAGRKPADTAPRAVA